MKSNNYWSEVFVFLSISIIFSVEFNSTNLNIAKEHNVTNIFNIKQEINK